MNLDEQGVQGVLGSLLSKQVLKATIMSAKWALSCGMGRRPLMSLQLCRHMLGCGHRSAQLGPCGPAREGRGPAGMCAQEKAMYGQRKSVVLCSSVMG
jgi:hypothetical protein